MENRLNFEAISDDELAKIVGGGYPNNQSMNDVLHWLNGHNDGIPNNYLNGWVVQVKMTKYIFPNLKDNQRDLFNIINQILSRDKLSIEERKCFFDS